MEGRLSTESLPFLGLKDEKGNDRTGLRFRLYLPAGYKGGAEGRYPVLYLLHGANGNFREEEWDAFFPLLEEMINKGAIPALIAVAPVCGNSYWVDSAALGPYESAVIRALIPFIDNKYNTAPGRENRFIAGFSVGGWGALRYEKAQRANRERLRDRKEWEKIKKIMPDEAPTFSGYRNMRKSDSERYNDLRYAVKVNDKLAAGNVDYTAKEWYNKHQETKAALIGTQTASGVKVSGVAHHITDRILERKVSLSDIMQSLQSPYKVSDVITDSQGRHSIRYFGENCYTAVNPDTGNAVTVIDKPRSKKKGGP